MPIKKIPIAESIIKAVDEVGLVTHGAELRDGYVDELGNINRRPGLVEFADTGEDAAVDGLHWWDSQDRVILVCNGKTFQITDNGGTIAEISGDTFEVGDPVVFADYGTAIYGANGAKIMKITTSAVAEMADEDAPTTVTHVGFLDRYLLANEVGSRNFHSSDVGAPDDWSGNSWDVEGKLDNLQALGVADLEILALCEKTAEVWVDDGTTPFVRELQGFIELGTMAPNSLAWCTEVADADGFWVWMDQYRRVVRLYERTPVELSTTMTKYIQAFTTVNDAIGNHMVIDGRHWYILHFPTEGETLAYELSSKRWYLWSYYNTGTATYDRWRGNCYCLSPDWNFALVGDHGNGKVYKFDASTYDDDGNSIRTMIRTAHINWGSELVEKRSKSLTFRVKKSNVDAVADAAELLVKWRDDGNSSWQTEMTVALGQVGNTEFRGHLRRLGKYHSRQYQITLTDDHPLLLVSVEEDFDFLR
jgi:hypothetical protein